MITDDNVDEFRIWYDNGVANGWISQMTCATHDGIGSISEEEEAAWEAGEDPCQFVVRILE